MAFDLADDDGHGLVSLPALRPRSRGLASTGPRLPLHEMTTDDDDSQSVNRNPAASPAAEIDHLAPLHDPRRKLDLDGG